MITVTNPSYDRVHDVYAWRDNNICLVLTQGEGATVTDGSVTRIKAPRFRLRDDQGIIDLSGSPTVVLAVTRPDQSEDLVACTVESPASDGVISCPILASVTAFAGQAVGEIRVISENGVIKFYGIHARIHKGVSDSAAARDSRYSALTKALQKVTLLTPEGTAKMDETLEHGGTNPVASGVIYDFVTALTALDTSITDNGTKPVASGTLKNYLEGSFQDYLVERFTKRIYAHETHSSGYDADTNPVDTYSDGGVYIDEALDPSTIYIIKNSNGAHIGTLLCAHANGYNRTTQIALYSDGRFQYRYRHNTSGVWDEWENIARDSTVFDAVVRNYQDVTPDITFDIHNTAIATYLTESAVYSPNDYDVTKVPTSLSGTPYDTPNATTIDLPTGSSKVILYDTVAKTEQVISVSGSTYTITNLIPNRVYAYTVRNSSGTMLSYGTVKATGHIRMIDGGGNTFNIRDLGGWTCDGGKTKYGLIYRGAELNGAVSLNSSQVDFFKNVLGIRDEIDLRNPTSTGVGSGALGLGVDYVNIYTNYSPYALQDLYRQERVDIIKRIAKNIKEKKVTYIHCSAGADRTAIICTFIEAICGVSQNDIDRDYELTAFAYDTNNNRLSTRTRNSTWLNGHRVMINGDGTETYSYPYINNMEGSSFQDKIVRFLLRSGVTIDELNDIRFGLIDGNPAKLSNPYSEATVTTDLAHVFIDNEATSVQLHQPFEANLTVEDWYKLDYTSTTSYQITMGGTDITSNCANGKIRIARVTGNISITAKAADNEARIEGEISDLDDRVGGKISDLDDRFELQSTVGFDGNGIPVFVSNNTSFSAGACQEAGVETLFIASNVTTISGGAFNTNANQDITTVYIDNKQADITVQSGAFPSGATVYYKGQFNALGFVIAALQNLNTSKSDNVKKMSVTVRTTDWSSNSYDITSLMPASADENTKVDAMVSSTVQQQLVADGCGGIYVSTDTSNSTTTFTMHALYNVPTANITVQLMLTQLVSI